jgi:hypothetical protein
LTIKDSQKFSVSLDARDAKGNPASFDGKPTFAVDRTDLLTVTPSADGMTAEVAAVGPLGSAQLTATVDAAIGPNVVPIIGTLTVDVVGGQATVVALNATAPVEQDAQRIRRCHLRLAKAKFPRTAPALPPRVGAL